MEHPPTTQEEADEATAAREEAEHFEAVARAFGLYGTLGEAWVARCEAEYALLPPAHRALLTKVGLTARHAALRQAVRQNAQFTALLVGEHQRNSGVFENSRPPERPAERLTEAAERLAASEFYADKVRTTLVQIARDWSEEGRSERDAAYGPLLEALERRWPEVAQRRGVRVLTPGAGLGRLTFEIARRGFGSEGNEFSYFMLLASSLVLNHTTRVGQFALRPWIRHSTNVRCAADQLREVRVPDVVPGDDGFGTMAMTAGDFLEVYGTAEQRGMWDCVVTCFFLDTAHNALAYIDTIAGLLRAGGVWLNLGPLLWHFADMPHEHSVELTWEEVRGAIVASGFVLEKEAYVRASYDLDSRSLLNVMYDCIFFSAVRSSS